MKNKNKTKNIQGDVQNLSHLGLTALGRHNTIKRNFFGRSLELIF